MRFGEDRSLFVLDATRFALHAAALAFLHSRRVGGNQPGTTRHSGCFSL